MPKTNKTQIIEWIIITPILAILAVVATIVALCFAIWLVMYINAHMWHKLSLAQARVVAASIHLGPSCELLSAKYYGDHGMDGAGDSFYEFVLSPGDIPRNWDDLCKTNAASTSSSPSVGTEMPDWWRPATLPDARALFIDTYRSKFKVVGYWIVYSRTKGIVYVDGYSY